MGKEPQSDKLFEVFQVGYHNLPEMKHAPRNVHILHHLAKAAPVVIPTGLQVYREELATAIIGIWRIPYHHLCKIVAFRFRKVICPSCA